MQIITIEGHWDTGAIITAEDDPVVAFAEWQQHARANPDEWNGDEFTLQDFERYIEELGIEAFRTNEDGSDKNAVHGEGGPHAGINIAALEYLIATHENE